LHPIKSKSFFGPFREQANWFCVYTAAEFSFKWPQIEKNSLSHKTQIKSSVRFVGIDLLQRFLHAVRTKRLFIKNYTPALEFHSQTQCAHLINRLLAFHDTYIKISKCVRALKSPAAVKIKRLVSQAREFEPILIVTVRIIGLFE
jgi:hypothetical protein